MASQLKSFLRRDNFYIPRLTWSIFAKWIADSCPMLFKTGLSRLSTFRELLFQLRTLVMQIIPSISIELFARFSYSSTRELSSFDEKSKFFVIAWIIIWLRWLRWCPLGCFKDLCIECITLISELHLFFQHLMALSCYPANSDSIECDSSQ